MNLASPSLRNAPIESIRQTIASKDTLELKRMLGELGSIKAHLPPYGFDYMKVGEWVSEINQELTKRAREFNSKH